MIHNTVVYCNVGRFLDVPTLPVSLGTKFYVPPVCDMVLYHCVDCDS